LPRVDVLVGGPPCQGFASVGRAKIRSLNEEQKARLAHRNHLYQEFLRFVEVLRPLCFVMENVPQLATYDEGRVAARVREDFERLEYDVGVSGVGDPWLLRAERFGVPETRQRLFFVGVRRGFTGPVAPPRPTHQAASLKRDGADGQTATQLSLGKGRSGWAELHLPRPRTLADAIADLPRVPAPSLDHVRNYVPEVRTDLIASQALGDAEYRALMRAELVPGECELLYDHVVRPVREDDAQAFLHIPPGGTYRDVPLDYRRYRLEDEHFEDRYYRLPWDRPSRAITAHIAKDGYWYIHPDFDQVRTLSVREAARVQSFPDHFRFAGHRTNMYRQIGNAVPPLLAYAIAQRLREAIGRGTGRGWSPSGLVNLLLADTQSAGDGASAAVGRRRAGLQNHISARP
jgi:DNA (cytosine-5)-methyltransferase 1